MYTNTCIIITSIYKIYADMNMEGNLSHIKQL